MEDRKSTESSRENRAVFRFPHAADESATVDSICEKLQEAESDIESGRTSDAFKTLASLRRKYNL